MERTLILVKPDAFGRGLTGEVIARFERKGLRIVALKHMQVERSLAAAARFTTPDTTAFHVEKSLPAVWGNGSTFDRALPSSSEASGLARNNLPSSGTSPGRGTWSA